MKCPECSGQQRYSQGMVCGKCGYRFRLSPKESGVPSGAATDGFISHVLKRAGCGGTARFTRNQLYAAARDVDGERLARARRKTFRGNLVGFIVVGGLLAAAFLLPFWPLLFFAGLVTLGTSLSMLSLLFPRRHLKRERWEEIVDKWDAAGGEIPGLITGRELSVRPEAPGHEDLYHYGFGKLLICEREEMVDSLVLNGFHTENACVVMAESGYPQHLLGPVQEELQRNPELMVFLWHDATEEGEGMGGRISEQRTAFALGDQRVTDLGLSRKEIGNGKRLRRLKKANGGVFPADIITAPRCAGVLGAALADFTTLGTVADGTVIGAMEILEGGVLRPRNEGGGAAGDHSSGHSLEISWEVSWEDSAFGDGDGDGDAE